MNLYAIWNSMKQRCHAPKATSYERYGGRGIKVCDEWRDNFQAFSEYVSGLEHFGEAGYSLDRIDNDGDYTPGNVRWADAKTQQRNRRNNHIIEYDGRQMTVAEAAELNGISGKILLSRINKGTPAEEWFLPAGKRGGRREGAGRKKGRVKENPNPRAHRQLLAYDDEWAVIKEFMYRVRKIGAQEAQESLETALSRRL